MDLLETQIGKLLGTSDAELAAAMRAKPTRQVMAEFLFALSQLLIHHEAPADITDVSVNFHGRALRVDIAKLTDDGQHLEAWLLGLNANPLDEACGASVPLPSTGPVQ